MPLQQIQHFQVPEWYSTERETEKTIQKLNSIKELDYYLQNPDEFVRRLAILRLQKITAKEAAYILKDILDSPSETPRNKYISGWILNSLLKGKDDVLLMGSRYAGNLTGSERFDELFPIISEKFHGSVNFNFDSSPMHSAFTLDKEDAVLERDVYFESEFDYGQWFKSFVVYAFANLRKAILAVPSFMGRVLKNFITRLSEHKKNKKHLTAERAKISEVQSGQGYASKDPGNVRSGKRKRHPDSYPPVDSGYSLRSELYKKQSFFTYVKKGAFQVFYGLFFPVRFVRRHKLLTFTMILAVYLLLANTDPGRAFTTKYFRLDLKPSQTFALQKLKVCTSYLSNGFNRLTGMDEWNGKGSDGKTNTVQANANSDLGSVSNGPVYTVSAKNGLNIRVSPSPGSGRVGSGPLEFGSTVVFLEKQEKDKSGITWYYVEAADGRIGWVSSRYLKEKEG